MGLRQEKHKGEMEKAQEERGRCRKEGKRTQRLEEERAGGSRGRKNNSKDRTKRGNWGEERSQEGKIKGQKGGVCELAGQGGAGAGEEQQPDASRPGGSGEEGKAGP